VTKWTPHTPTQDGDAPDGVSAETHEIQGWNFLFGEWQDVPKTRWAKGIKYRYRLKPDAVQDSEGEIGNVLYVKFASGPHGKTIHKWSEKPFDGARMFITPPHFKQRAPAPAPDSRMVAELGELETKLKMYSDSGWSEELRKALWKHRHKILAALRNQPSGDAVEAAKRICLAENTELCLDAPCMTCEIHAKAALQEQG